jgi:hypothetical protein
MRLLLASVVAIGMVGAAPADDNYIGTVSDDMCAMNHAAMRMGPTDAECTQACVEEHDAAYVLVSEGHVYKLSNQDAAKAYAGKKARVVGTVDAKTNTLAVTSITGA